MAKITVNKQTTYNQTPTITGTVEFERFDSSGNPKHTIQIVVNYITYKLFAGNLGIDETRSPNVWKLHIDLPLYPGTYDIEAQVIDLTTNTVIASDSTVDELQISVRQNYYTYPKPPELSLFQKFQLVNGLMNQMNRLFGGQNGISPVPSVHPAVDDQASTNEMGRGREEREQHPIPKSKDKTAKPNVNPKPNPQEFKATDSAAVNMDSPAGTELPDASGVDAYIGSKINDAPLEELGQNQNLPTTEQVMEGLGVAGNTQAEAPQGEPVYDAMGNFTGTYTQPTTEEVFNPGGQSGLGGTYENQPDETYREQFSIESNPADVDAALARAVATSQVNNIPNVVDAYLK